MQIVHDTYGYHLPPPVTDEDRAKSNDVETRVHHHGHNDGHHVARSWEKERRGKGI